MCPPDQTTPNKDLDQWHHEAGEQQNKTAVGVKKKKTVFSKPGFSLGSVCLGETAPVDMKRPTGCKNVGMKIH